VQSGFTHANIAKINHVAILAGGYRWNIFGSPVFLAFPSFSFMFIFDRKIEKENYICWLIYD
jgi:hypothetical protein